MRLRRCGLAALGSGAWLRHVGTSRAIPERRGELAKITGVGDGIAILAFAFHFWLRGTLSRRIARKLTPKYGQQELNLRAAFLKTSNCMRSIFTPEPAGWGNGPAKRLRQIRETLANHIQSLNDLYADPSGKTIEVVEEKAQTDT